MPVSLDFRPWGYLPVDASPLVPQGLLSLTPGQIERLPLHIGGHTLPMGEVCRAARSATDEETVVLTGATGNLHRLGWGMGSGRLVVEGDAGRWAGAGMQGGELVIQGSAGDHAGVGMRGGVIRIAGDAGNRAGGRRMGTAAAAAAAGMQGGILCIGGNAGTCLGSGMRRGLILVAGSTGDYTGEQMRAGTILVAGRLGKYAGLEMRRGSIAAGEAAVLLPGFTEACTGDFTWLRLVLHALHRRGVAVPPGWIGGKFRRYCGHDLAGDGRRSEMQAWNKGEILLYDRPE